MELKEITVTASVSKNYQKGEFTATATVESLKDIEELKELCKKNAMDILNSISAQTVGDKDPSEQFEEQPRRRQIVSQTGAPGAKKPNLVVGTIWRFSGTEYKLCKNKDNGELFWAIVNKDMISDIHPKYRKDFLE